MGSELPLKCTSPRLSKQQRPTALAPFTQISRRQGLQAVTNLMVPEVTRKTNVSSSSWGVHLRMFRTLSLSNHVYTRSQSHSSTHSRVLQLMKINLRIRWSNLTPLGLGAQGEQYITKDQFSIWCSWVKKVCKRRRKKTVQIKSRVPLQSKEGANREHDQGRSVNSNCLWDHTLFCALYFLFGLVIWTDFKILDWKSVTFTVVMAGGKHVQVWWDESEHKLSFSVKYIWWILIYFFLFPFLQL